MPMIMHRLRLAAAWPLVAALAFPACADEMTEEPDEMTEPLPPPDVRGKYLDVYLSQGARICRPTLERFDAEVERIAEALGVAPDPEERIVLHYGDWAVKELCDIEAEVGEFRRGGCADVDGQWIAAQPGVESHEIVHILRVRADLVGPAYWEEGLATYYGSSRPYGEFSVWPSGNLHPSQSLRSSEYPDQAGYTESAHFISFIEQTYGSEKLRMLSTALGADVEPGAAFQHVLGTSVEDVEARWKAEADHMYDLGPLCESTIVVGEEPLVIRGEIGCDVPGVLGPMSSSGHFRGPRYCFETPPGSTLTVTTRGLDVHSATHARALSSDVCPANEPNIGTNVPVDVEHDFETRGCEWSVTYVSRLEGDEYEMELVLR